MYLAEKKTPARHVSLSLSRSKVCARGSASWRALVGAGLGALCALVEEALSGDQLLTVQPVQSGEAVFTALPVLAPRAAFWRRHGHTKRVTDGGFDARVF